MPNKYADLLDPSEILDWFEQAPVILAEMMADLAIKAVMKRKRPRRAKKDDKQKPLDM